VNSVRSGHLKVEDSLLAGNEAGGSGGGMAAAGFADSEIVGTEVNGNRAGFSGGGIGLSEVTTLLCLEYSRPCSRTLLLGRENQNQSCTYRCPCTSPNAFLSKEHRFCAFMVS
jgi:hypothetical protein